MYRLRTRFLAAGSGEFGGQMGRIVLNLVRGDAVPSFSAPFAPAKKQKSQKANHFLCVSAFFDEKDAA